jgi:hypothetical protein
MTVHEYTNLLDYAGDLQPSLRASLPSMRSPDSTDNGLIRPYLRAFNFGKLNEDRAVDLLDSP